MSDDCTATPATRYGPYGLSYAHDDVLGEPVYEVVHTPTGATLTCGSRAACLVYILKRLLAQHRAELRGA